MIDALERQVAEALDSADPVEVATAQEAAAQAAATAAERAAALGRQALDPTVGAKQAHEAKAAQSLAEFDAERFRVAAARLSDWLSSVLQAAEVGERAARDAELQKRRAAATAQFDREYPILANRIAGLLLQLEAAGVAAPHVILKVRSDGPAPDVRSYWPHSSWPGMAPDDYAPSCEGGLIIKKGGVE